MLPESRDKMFDQARNNHSVWIGGNKFNRITDIISPQTRIVINNKRIILPNLYILKTKTRRRIGKYFAGRYKLKEDATISIKQQSFSPLRVLESHKTL